MDTSHDDRTTNNICITNKYRPYILWRPWSNVQLNTNNMGKPKQETLYN